MTGVLGSRADPGLQTLRILHDRFCACRRQAHGTLSMHGGLTLEHVATAADGTRKLLFRLTVCPHSLPLNGPLYLIDLSGCWTTEKAKHLVVTAESVGCLAQDMHQLCSIWRAWGAAGGFRALGGCARVCMSVHEWPKRVAPIAGCGCTQACNTWPRCQWQCQDASYSPSEQCVQCLTEGC